MPALLITLFALLGLLFLPACQNLKSLGIDFVSNRYQVGGTLTGLVGHQLELGLHTTKGEPTPDAQPKQSIIIEENGSFTFPEGLTTGSAFYIRVEKSPQGPAQHCQVDARQTGVVGKTEFTGIHVECQTRDYSISGTVQGLKGSGLEITLNGTEKLAIGKNGFFGFDEPLRDGEEFGVLVTAQPTSPEQFCTPSGGSGTLFGREYSDVVITCSDEGYVSAGFVVGLEGSGLVLRNNGGDDLEIIGSGFFRFGQLVADGSEVNVQVETQPTGPNQTCSVYNVPDSIRGTDKVDTIITCNTVDYPLGGMVTGLAGEGLVLELNGGSETLVTANGEFSFSKEQADGSRYVARVRQQPQNPAQVCAVENSGGTINGDPVDNIIVRCDTSTFAVGGFVDGYTGQGLYLRLNNGSPYQVTANGFFQMPNHVTDASPYEVAIAAQPADPRQICEISQPTGIINNETIDNIFIECENAFTLSGEVSGLEGGGLVLENTVNGDLLLLDKTTDSPVLPLAYELARGVKQATAYNLEIKNQPTGLSQTCAFDDGGKAASLATFSDVSDIHLTCVTNKFTVSGAVTGLEQNSLTLRLNGDFTSDIILSADGGDDLSFHFDSHAITDGENYDVNIHTPAPGHFCSVNGGHNNDGSGALSGANITDIVVDCEIDDRPPTVTTLSSSPGPGPFIAGQTIDIVLKLNKDITVDDSGGTPTLSLNSGGSAEYTSGSGSDELIFTYTVQPGDDASILDVTGTDALILNGGNITDGLGEDLDTTLPEAGSGNQLADTTITVDAYVATLADLTLKGAYDSGTSDSDLITRTSSIDFSGTAEPGATINITESNFAGNAATTADGDGNWSVAYSLSDGEGAYSFTATQTDLAGNTSPANNPLVIMLDTLALPPSVPDLDPGSDDGGSSTDNITSISTGLVFNGTAEPDAFVEFYLNGITLIGSTTADGGGNFSGSLNLAVGLTHQVSARQTDIAGNTSVKSAPLAVTVNAGIPPAITSAETMDIDGNGYIDHYKLTFDRDLDDSTFIGYNGTNAEGNSAAALWMVAGYSNPRVDTTDGRFSPEDTDNDNIIYLAFNEGSVPDTGAKPDLTTSGSGGVYSLETVPMAQLYSGDVTEADRAPAAIVAAWSDPIIDAWQLRMELSEPADTTSGDMTCAGSLVSGDLLYTDTSGDSVSALRSDFGDANGCDLTDGAYQINIRTDSRFTFSDLGSDTVALNTTLFDNADNPANSAFTPVITTDPRLEIYYPMDAALGDTDSLVQDVSGHGRDGTLLGSGSGQANLGANMADQSDQAYHFDGDDSPVQNTAYAGVQGSGARTVSVWFQAIPNLDIGLFNQTNGSEAWVVSIADNRRLQVWTDGGSVQTDYQFPLAGGWRHIAVTYDPTDGPNLEDHKFYIDGRLVTHGSAAIALNTNSTRVRLGNTSSLRGALDEVRYYSRALSANEVSKLATKVPAGLVAHYQLDGDATDDTGNALDGTLVGSPGAANDRYANGSGSYTFDGSTQYITVADNSLLKPANSITIAAWAYHSNWSGCDSGDPSILSKGESGDSGVYFECDSATNELAFILGRDGTKIKIGIDPSSLSGGAWHHLTGTYDGRTMKFYVNGVLKNTNDAGASYSIDHSNDVFYIAQDWESEEFPGSIDDVRVYDRALTAGEVKALATELDRDLVAYYPLDDNTTSTTAGAIKDYSGSGYNGTLAGTGTPMPVADRLGNPAGAYGFDRSNSQYIEVTSALNLPQGDTDRTVCSHVTISTFQASGYMSLLAYGTTTDGEATILGLNPDKMPGFSGWNVGYRAFSPVIAPLSTWNHYCVTHSASDTKFYFNGQIESQISPTLLTNGTTLRIGDDLSGSNNWNGSIDDVRIYDRVLSIEEIRQLSGFHPGQLDDISLLLDASRGAYNDAGSTLASNGQAVQEWHDSSFTNGSTNGINVTQGTASNRPAWRQSVTAINNMPVIRFDGIDDRLSRTVLGTDILTAQAYSIFAVMMQDGTQAENGLIQWGFNGNDRMTLVPTQNDTIRFMGSRLHNPSGMTDVAQPAGWDDNYHTLYAWLSSSSGEINVDGTTIHSFGNMWYDMTNTGSTLGLNIGSENNGQRLKGDIAEIMMFKRAPSQGERDQIVCYFHRKYGIAVSTDCD